ncbi:MAG: FtsX-like permease family protein [Chitinophagaceae bacterium]|nr:FtsX-like permease family protein [Chitinophagaceae bacterium]
MIKSYIKTAFRFLLKNKTFSFINIFGLTVGTLCCLYIVLFVSEQYSYDKQHAGAIYRVNQHFINKNEGKDHYAATVVAPVVPLMKKDFPEVEQFTRVVPFLGVDKHLLRYRDKVLYEKDAAYVDSTFFTVFNYHFLSGSPLTALAEPYSIVLLKPTADKLFGTENPVGKRITIDNVNGKSDYTVKAVIDESLGKSHLHANIFITMNSGDVGDYMLHTDSWTRNGYVSSYVRLRPGTNLAQLEKKFPAFIDKYAGEQEKTIGNELHFFLQPLRTIHVTTGLESYQFTNPVSPEFLTILLIIAVLIQIIACINFMNLSTARASKRAKEVGIRKVIGAERRDLVKQFLGESFLLTIIGVLLALPLLLIAMPYINQITRADIQLSFFSDYRLWILIASLVIITGLVAGSYPAFYLSAFKAIKIIKGNFTSHISAAGIRRSLVVFQFVLSLILITGVIIIYSQLNYIKNKDLGFDKNQKLIFSFYTGDAIDQLPGFMNDLRGLSGVKTVSNASQYLSSPVFYSNSFFLRGQKENEAKNTEFIITDEHFVNANGIKLVNGRDFRPTDSAKVMINETYARQLGLTSATAVGTYLYDNQNRVEEIVGVMKDFNYSTLHKDVAAFLIWMRKPKDDVWPNVIVNTNTTNYKSLLAKIETLWHKDIAGTPFSYAFLDEQVGKQYETEITLSRIINSFTLMAIVISCLGLFGLAAFNAEQRSKEISIRKVLGASMPGIVQLLSKDFLKLIIIAFIIAVPISWWTMNQWLQAFAYKITITWWMFGISGLVVVFIALSTVSFQALKAAIVNPIESLRTE